MASWRSIIAKYAPQLAERFHEDEQVKEYGLQMLQTLDVPRYRYIKLPLVKFLKNPQKYFRIIGTDLFFINLTSDVRGKERMRNYDASAQEVLDFIKTHVLCSETERFNVFLYEYFPNIYGGNLIINMDGSAVMEVTEGKHGKLTSGEKTPRIVGWTNQFTHVFSIHDESVYKAYLMGVEQQESLQFGDTRQAEKNLQEQTVLLSALYHAYRCIPRDTFVEDWKVAHPGYYEFILVHPPKDPDTLVPIFIDYREPGCYATA